MKRVIRTVPAVLAATLLAACSSGGSSPGATGAVDVAAVQPPDGAARSACDALAGALPSRVEDGSPRKVTPASPYSAAWGAKPITLRCGVATPKSLRPNDPAYDPEQNSVVVNCVSWTFQVLGGGGVRFTTLDRAANVELTVPKGVSVQQPTAPLVDVADAISKTVPATMDDGC